MTNSCSRKHRCGTCHQCEIVFARRRAAAARESSKNLEPGLRICADCGQVKPETSFLTGRFRCRECHHIKAAEWIHQRKLRDAMKPRVIKKKHLCKDGCGTPVMKKGRSCWPCYVADRQRNAAPRKPKRTPKPKVIKSPKPKPVVAVEHKTPQKHPCEGGCGTYVIGGTQLCRVCKSARQKQITALAERNLRNRRAESVFKNSKTLGLMWIGQESLSMSNQCSRCSKPVIINTLCYSCATNKPRTITILPVVEYAPAPV